MNNSPSSSTKSDKNTPRTDITPLSMIIKPPPSLVILPPPPSDKNCSKSDVSGSETTESKSNQLSPTKQTDSPSDFEGKNGENESNIKTNKNDVNNNSFDHDDDGSDEEWGWGEFVHHGANFADFPSQNFPIIHEYLQKNSSIQQNDEDDDICIIHNDNPFNQIANVSVDVNDIPGQVKLCLEEIISKINNNSINNNIIIERISPSPSDQSIGTINTVTTTSSSPLNENHISQPESPSFFMISEVGENVLNLRERESSTESENLVVISVETENNTIQDSQNNYKDDLINLNKNATNIIIDHFKENKEIKQVDGGGNTSEILHDHSNNNNNNITTTSKTISLMNNSNLNQCNLSEYPQISLNVNNSDDNNTSIVTNEEIATSEFFVQDHWCDSENQNYVSNTTKDISSDEIHVIIPIVLEDAHNSGECDGDVVVDDDGDDDHDDDEEENIRNESRENQVQVQNRNVDKNNDNHSIELKLVGNIYGTVEDIKQQLVE